MTATLERTWTTTELVAMLDGHPHNTQVWLYRAFPLHQGPHTHAWTRRRWTRPQVLEALLRYTLTMDCPNNQPISPFHVAEAHRLAHVDGLDGEWLVLDVAGRRSWVVNGDEALLAARRQVQGVTQVIALGVILEVLR